MNAKRCGIVAAAVTGGKRERPAAGDSGSYNKRSA